MHTINYAVWTPRCLHTLAKHLGVRNGETGFLKPCIAPPCGMRRFWRLENHLCLLYLTRHEQRWITQHSTAYGRPHRRQTTELTLTHRDNLCAWDRLTTVQGTLLKSFNHGMYSSQCSIFFGNKAARLTEKVRSANCPKSTGAVVADWQLAELPQFVTQEREESPLIASPVRSTCWQTL